MKPRISMITLGVRDLAVSVRFYEEGLGLPRLESPPLVAFFNLDGSWLGLYGREALAEDADVSPAGEGFESFALAHNVASDAEVDAVVKQAVSAGGTLVKTPQKAFWGGYSGYFKDPDGHLWEVAHNPFMWVGPPDEEPGEPLRDQSDVRYVVLHRPGPTWQRGVDFREQPGVMAHVTHYRRLHAKGLLEAGGPFLDQSGGMMIPSLGTTRESIETFAARDPAVLSGLLEFEVRPWYVAMKAPIDGAPR